MEISNQAEMRNDCFDPCSLPIPSNADGDTDVFISEQKSPSTERPFLRHPIGSADPTIVYVLGDIKNSDDTTTRYLEQHSGINGYIIRTIPAERRWTNPVLVGAGKQRLAVVDRSEPLDTIRVTDKYVGADPALYDSDELYDTIDWENLEDAFSLPMPAGWLVKGLTITDGDVLIATLDDQSGEETTRYYTYDFQGFDLYTGHKELPKPFKMGTAAGVPCQYNSLSAESMTLFAMAANRVDDTSAGVAIVDFARNEVQATASLPTGWEPVSVTAAQNIVNVLAKNAADSHKIFRYFFEPRQNFSGNTSMPPPDPSTVTKTFVEQDIVGAIFDEGLRQHDPDTFGDIEPVYKENRTQGRSIAQAQTDDLNENRADATEDFTLVEATENNTRTRVASLTVIDIEDTSKIKSADCSQNSTTELYTKEDGEGEIDDTQIVWRMVHGTFYDWLSDGGFSYGCGDDSGPAHETTSGIRGVSLACDLNTELGAVKDFPDMKIALIDSDTGYFIYRYPKPLGKKVFGGGFLHASPQDETRTICTTKLEDIAEQIDGVSRSLSVLQYAYGTSIGDSIISTDYLTKSAEHPSKFSNLLDINFPFSYFKRRTKEKTPITAKLDINYWSTYRLIPQVNGLGDPVEDGRGNQFLYIDGTKIAEFDGLTDPSSTSLTQTLFLDALGLNAALPTPARAPALTSLVSTGYFVPNMAIEAKEDDTGATLELSDAIQARSFSPLEQTVAQKLSVADGVVSDPDTTVSSPGAQTPYAVIQINERLKGIVIPSSTLVKSWIRAEFGFPTVSTILGIGSATPDISSNPTFLEGAQGSVWRSDAWYDNGLGTLIDSILLNTPFSNSPVHVYDSGDMLNLRIDGDPAPPSPRGVVLTISNISINGTVTETDQDLAPIDINYAFDTLPFGDNISTVPVIAVSSGIDLVTQISFKARMDWQEQVSKMITYIYNPVDNPKPGRWDGFYTNAPGVNHGLLRDQVNDLTYRGTPRNIFVPIWEGVITVTMPSSTPYKTKSLLYGHCMDVAMQFSFNRNILDYRVVTR